MSLSPNSENLLLGSGATYCDIYKNGVRTGEFHFGNVTAFSIATSDEIKEKYSSMDKSRGLYKAVNTKRTITLKITGDEFSLENTALNAMGSIGSLTQTSGSVVGETVTASSKKGRYYATAKRNISDVVVKVGAGTKTVGTDYTVDANTGRIYIVPTGTIADESTVLVDYEYSTVSLETVEGGTEGLIECFIRFIGDPAAGPAYEVQVWKAQISPDGEFGLISDDFGNWSLTCKVLNCAAEHPDSPYYRAIKLN